MKESIDEGSEMEQIILLLMALVVKPITYLVKVQAR